MGTRLKLRKAPSQGSKGCNTTQKSGKYFVSPLPLSDLVNHRFVTCISTNSVGKPDDVMSILRATMEANPSRSVYLPTHSLISSSSPTNSFLLTFTSAEAQELNKEYEDIHTTFDKTLATLQAQIKCLIASSPSNPPVAAQPGKNDFIGATHHRHTVHVFAASSSFEYGETTDLTECKAENGLAYIVYMRFAWRTESVKMSGPVFGRARKAPLEVFRRPGTYPACPFLISNISLIFFFSFPPR